MSHINESEKENINNEYKKSENYDLNNTDDLNDYMGDVSMESIVTQQKLTDSDMKYLLAACESNFQKLNSILSKNPHLVNMKNPLCDGFTALHFACKFGTLEVIRSLLGNYKADVDIVSNSGKTPLHVAVQFKQEEAARLLLSTYNAKKTLRDYSGKLPADLLPEEGMDTFMKLVGPSTTATVQKHNKVQTPMSLNVKKSFLSVGSSGGGSESKGFSLFRKGSEAAPHGGGHGPTTLTANSHNKDSAHSPSTLHVTDHDKFSLKKNLSFLSRPIVKHSASSRAKSPHKEEETTP